MIMSYRNNDDLAAEQNCFWDWNLPVFFCLLSRSFHASITHLQGVQQRSSNAPGTNSRTYNASKTHLSSFNPSPHASRMPSGTIAGTAAEAWGSRNGLRGVTERIERWHDSGKRRRTVCWKRKRSAVRMKWSVTEVSEERAWTDQQSFKNRKRDESLTSLFQGYKMYIGILIW